MKSLSLSNTNPSELSTLKEINNKKAAVAASSYQTFQVPPKHLLLDPLNTRPTTRAAVITTGGVGDDEDDGKDKHSKNEIADHESLLEEEGDDLYGFLDEFKEELLDKVNDFTLPYDSERGYRGTKLAFCSFMRPHMRAFHASWICFFTSFFVQFSQAPLLPEMGDSLHLTRSQVWWTNLWMMLGGVPTRFLLGPLCDKYGVLGNEPRQPRPNLHCSLKRERGRHRTLGDQANKEEKIKNKETRRDVRK